MDNCRPHKLYLGKSKLYQGSMGTLRRKNYQTMEKIDKAKACKYSGRDKSSNRAPEMAGNHDPRYVESCET